ncbi:MAG: cytochrome P450 [Microthrixaceae bacterium]
MKHTGFDPTALGESADVYATLAAARRQAPVAGTDLGFVALTGYRACAEALRHPGCRSGPIAELYLAALPPGAARDELSHRINFLDPPDHTRVRGLVSKAFTPRRMARMVPWMEETANSLLDGLEGRPEVELLSEFAHQLPSLVISELLGVPPGDRSLLTSFSDQVAPLLGVSVDPDAKQLAIEAAEAFHAYLTELADDRARHPGDDLLSALLAAEGDGHRLSRPELMSLAATLYSAGHRTTRDAFANGMTVLLSDPERYRDVVEGRWPLADVVAELLRLETPTLYVARVTAEPLALDGVEVGEGQAVLVFLSAANRDPAVYAAPDEFRPGRQGPPNLSFAFGAHFCLGAALARSELEVMLGALTRRWPKLALSGDAPGPWHLRGPFRGVDSLEIRPGG